MKHLGTRRLGVFLAAVAVISIAAACGDLTLAFPREGAPERLEFSLSGWEGMYSRAVELRRDTVVLRRRDPGASAADSVRVVPTAAQWRDFWAAAEDAGVNRWRRRYADEGIQDGGFWHLRLQAEGESIVSEGYSAYPDRFGREHEGESTPDFRGFVDALGDLVGEPIR